jgi:hypothetical protein
MDISPHKLPVTRGGVLNTGYIFPNNIPQTFDLYVNFALGIRKRLRD